MSNQKIPNFISTNFKFMSEMVRIVNRENESFISQEQMDGFEKRYEISVDILLRYKILYSI